MTSKIELAAKFINTTAQHVFLTGKAGTGKTTFLNDLAAATHKNFLVVAPTGIAAINAGGTTIHSQFMLPLGSFIPETSGRQSHAQGGFFSAHDLNRRHSLNRERRKVLRSLDLLVIDEVSMLRADILDAIDSRLKSAKGNYEQSFGGVQLLLVGDLYQLPPIIKPQEWEVLQKWYNSIHFFNALALQKAGFVYLEFDKVFRQTNATFIELLNNLRANRCTAQDIALLNQYYQPKAEEAGVINITTHNHKAKAENHRQLKGLKGKSHFYEATVQDEFPESMFPLPERLEFKVGAQVMFIKNASDGSYFNGKLARVKALKPQSICVETDEEAELWVESYTWKNIRYKVQEQSQEVEEEVIGTFAQFPLKLAWAITVHKSQGLTFEKARLDLGEAFAPGQVYVALSRLRSLEGLRLSSKVSAQSIYSDAQITGFVEQHQQDELLEQRLQEGRQIYAQTLVQEIFSIAALSKQISYTRQKMAGKLTFSDDDLNHFLERWQDQIQGEQGHLNTFVKQLVWALHQVDYTHFQNRLKAGCSYYQNFFVQCYSQLMVQTRWLEQLKKVKTYLGYLEELEQLVVQQLKELAQAQPFFKSFLAEKPFKGEAEVQKSLDALRLQAQELCQTYLHENPKDLSNTGRKRKKKGETYEQSYALIHEGLSLSEIAKKRDLALSTIESHAARGLREGELKLPEVLSPADQKKLAALFEKYYQPKEGLKPVFAASKGAISYGKLKIWEAHLQSLKKD